MTKMVAKAGRAVGLRMAVEAEAALIPRTVDKGAPGA
jgi:hypothetical protein